MYYIFLCYNGNKKQVASKYVFNRKSYWEWEKEYLPYDIIDEDEHNVWFDWGDCEDVA